MNAQDRGAEPAYPTVVHEYRRRDDLGGMFVLESSTGHAGLSMREAFAMAAMQGLLANPYYAENSSTPSGHDNLHAAAVWHADQQLLALNQEPRT